MTAKVPTIKDRLERIENLLSDKIPRLDLVQYTVDQVIPFGREGYPDQLRIRVNSTNQGLFIQLSTMGGFTIWTKMLEYDDKIVPPWFR